ncbi:CDP-glycerol glycerophosphotransferase family protein [Haloarcula onubensis]|uniref:CDP-glycerol glycerophosphotransferase family protein n=1 Tax=Haloarcula onubensis TaxID=2950539 RepID=A0ABU2FQK6_9EURY|nr:CDP-glycerol glycerophosphotransferase family protein [Halomicroarcula sp. S3CR25-11]MDS0283045.1 CDP-glycerol glycerophosphotransferase family protein [Halomicroarcula sp. S3CR25-11]
MAPLRLSGLRSSALPCLASARSWASSVSLTVRAATHLLVERALPAGRRDSTRWVFGTRGGEGFVDNAKYLFLHVANERPEIRAVWLSKDKATVATLRARGYEAFLPTSPTGMYNSLRAGVVVVSHGVADVNLACSGGADIVQLWHGIPLKSIAWDAELSDRPAPERLARASLLDRTDVVSITASTLVEPFSSGFRIDSDRLVVSGYPRLDALLDPVDDEDIGVDAAAALEARRTGADRPVIGFLPTFRDSAADRASTVYDFEALAAFLAERDALALVKFHPNESVELDREHPRLVQVDPETDPYPLLRYVDVLVTDYSSVAFDFLLLDRPIVYFPYDLSTYREERGFYFDYESVTPGLRATDFEGLLDAVGTALDDDAYTARRRAVRERFFDRVDSGHAERAYRAIVAHLDGQ